MWLAAAAGAQAPVLTSQVRPWAGLCNSGWSEPDQLKQGQRDLSQDETDNDGFQTQRALSVDKVGHHSHCLADEVEFVRQRLGSFDEFVFVFQARVEAFQVGPVPQDMSGFSRTATRSASRC